MGWKQELCKSSSCIVPLDGLLHCCCCFATTVFSYLQNLSEEVEVEAFYEFFSRFGEILQCKTDTDNYGQYFGQAQYMETASVAAAVDGANGTRWHGAVIQVVPHHKAAQAGR
jgi:RNA recognition motif-containing protein